VISEVVMPQMGADMKEGTVLRWLKAEGDPVERGEVIAEIETDKANIEIEAFEAGVFRKVLIPEGETVEVGTVIAVIAAPDDDISGYAGGSPAKTAAPPAKAEPPPGTVAPARPEAPAPEAAPAAEHAPVGRVRASPVARRLAADLGIDLARLTGSGPDGRIVRRDVEAAVTGPAPAPEAAPAAAPAPPSAGPPVTTASLSRIRQTIARRMAQSKREAPHYYLTLDIDMTDALRFRERANAALEPEGVRASINDVIILAVARTLPRHPKFNSWWQDDQLQLHARVNVGVAIALDDGLIAPAILDCAAKPLSQIARESRDLAERARGGALKPDEYTAGTFTITNLGAFGVGVLIGIINPPQTAILGVGAVEQRPVVRDGQVVARPMMTVALSADHRVTDGVEGARFLQTLKSYLESPALMLV
jgi:pyruvate dehydrogenase E2 component (dihydrolipoamide acetyltransferase)